MKRKMFDSSDDYDFAPSGSSKLASLFDSSFSSDKSSSLIYTAPKQPKTKKDVDITESTKVKSQTSVILVKVVTLWKLEDKDYTCLGKHGLAIIGSVDLNLFEIISYKEKSNIILRRKIDNKCNIYNQKDHFSSFYDNEDQNWLVKFENSIDQEAFYKEIRSRGANIVANSETDSPASLENSVAGKKDVLKPDILPRENIITKPEVLPRLSQVSEKEIEETNSDSSGSQTRASILSRMAKMGQPILPNGILKNPSTDISDSELDDGKIDHKVPPRKFKRAVPFERHSPKEEKIVQDSQSYMEGPVLPAQGNSVNYSLQPPAQNIVTFPQTMMSPFPANMVSPLLVNQAMPYDGFQQYIVSQNTDLKMNLAQISAKLDSVLNTDIRSGNIDNSNLKSKIKTLELRSENLLTELERYGRKYDDLQKKCKKLEEQNIETTNSKFVIENLSKQVDDLKEELKSAADKNSKCEMLEMRLEKYESDIQEYEKTIDIQKLKLNDFEGFYEQNKDLQHTVDSLNDTISNLKLKLRDFEEYFLKTQEEKKKDTEGKEEVINLISRKVKDHMNDMYQSFLANFEESELYSVPQIKLQIAQNLKGTTFAIIQEFQDVYDPKNAATSDQ